MSRKRGRGNAARIARTPYALDHTAIRSRAPRDIGPEYSPESEGYSPDSGGFFTPSVRPLIRTVLAQPAPQRFRKRTQSPLVPVRASMRSFGKATRSPFLNATLVTPQLADRAIVCAKRNIRREVLFAIRRTGKGSGSPRRPKSKVKC